MTGWVRRLGADLDEPVEVLGGKAFGLVTLLRLDLPVPPGFVIGADAGRVFLADGRLPDGLESELGAAMAELELATGRRFGAARDPLAVSVRSGAAVSMPGMMRTILNLGAEPTAHPLGALVAAVRDVFTSWDTPRARTYRELHGIPHDAGTAVTVQAMVFGDRDARSGAGVAFSRDPNTGAPDPYGELLFGHRGDDVVAGTALTRPLAELAEREPAAWAELLAALRRIEEHHRDAGSVEFTVESGALWLLQVRPGGLAGRAAVRVAVDLADAGVISRAEAVRRVPAAHRQAAGTARIDPAGPLDLLTRGLGACPGVAAGRVATTAEAAVRMAAEGPVILFRPHTSPVDLPGLAAAAGVVTAAGGPASHAAVVARSMGRPAVVSAAGLAVDPAGRCVRAGGRMVAEGTLVTIDGTGGEVVLGPAAHTTEPDPHLRRLLSWS